MKSVATITGLVIDGEITNRAQAQALVTEEAQERAKLMEISEEEAREDLLASIRQAANYYSPQRRDYIVKLFSQENSHE